MSFNTQTDFSRQVIQHPDTLATLSGNTNILGQFRVHNVEINTADLDASGNTITPPVGSSLVFDGTKYTYGNPSAFMNRITIGMGLTVNPSNALIYDVSAGSYVVNGTNYGYTGGSITIPSGDTSLYRFDTVYITSGQTSLVKVGTPAPSPIVPTVTNDELEIGVILVPPGYYSGSTGSTIFTPPTVESPFKYNSSYTNSIFRTDDTSYVNSYFAMALSRDSIATGQDSITLGIGTVTSGNSQTALGRFNALPTNDEVLVIGSGTDNLTRETAFLIDSSGNTYVNKKFFVDNIELEVVSSNTFGQYLMFDGVKYIPSNLFIGLPESGTTYLNGLFNDLSPSSTTIGTFVDRVNKQLALGIGDRFTSNFTVNLSGGKPFGKYTNGQVVPASGKTATELLLDMAIEYIAPVWNSFTNILTTSIEIGTTLPTSTTFNWSISLNNGTVPTINIFDVNNSTTILSNTPNDGTQANVPIGTIVRTTHNSTYSWRGVFTTTNTPIQTLNSGNYTVTWRRRVFFGPTTAIPNNSAGVRTLPNNPLDTTNTYTLNTGSVNTVFIIALPSGRSLVSVVDQDALNAVITSSYVNQGPVNVLLADNTTPLSYTIYAFVSGVPYSSNHRHNITIA